jgi:pimeloyl-ACP methyl ester carboxylesterase
MTAGALTGMEDKVLLLHGIACSSASFAKLERRLRAAGFRTLNLSYPSRRHALGDLVEAVHGSAAGFIGQDAAPVHFVTHSMGGLVARAYVARYRPQRLGRAVMLGPPNQGSELADLLAETLLYRRFFGPAGGQLTTYGDEALRRLLGEVDYPLGVIAGDRSLNPLASLVIPGPNDGRVSVARTAVAGMVDHLTLHVSHQLMMRNPTVMAQTIHFLQHGRFAATVRNSRYLNG